MAGREEARQAFREAHDRWNDALQAHRLAPPDAGFAGRLRALAEASEAKASSCRAAAGAGFGWQPIDGAEEGEPPYELRPETGRRGPVELWATFDEAVGRVNHATSGSDMLAVAEAYEALANTTAALADAVEVEDQPPPPSRRRGR
jgi:hypothetical protein